MYSMIPIIGRKNTHTSQKKGLRGENSPDGWSKERYKDESDPGIGLGFNINTGIREGGQRGGGKIWVLDGTDGPLIKAT